MQSTKILKEFGFHTDEVKKIELPLELTLVIKSGQHYTFKTATICKISTLIANAIEVDKKTTIDLPDKIDEKYMMFLADYSNSVEMNNGIPKYDEEIIKIATTLENAIGPLFYRLFEKHFNYKFMRSDVAVKHFLDIFGHFLECSTIIISEPLIELFSITHKIIIQHLASADYIIPDD